MRNPPRNNPPYESPTGRHSALRFFFCPVFQAAGLFPSPLFPAASLGAPTAISSPDTKACIPAAGLPILPQRISSPPFSFALLFPDASPPGAPSAAFFAIALIGRPLPTRFPDAGLCFSRWSLSSPLRTFSPPFSFAFLFPDASSPGALSAAFFAIAPIGCPLSAGSPDMGLCFSRRSLRTSHSPFLPGRTFALPSPVRPPVSALRQPIPGRTKKQRMSKTSAVFQL